MIDRVIGWLLAIVVVLCLVDAVIGMLADVFPWLLAATVLAGGGWLWWRHRADRYW